MARTRPRRKVADLSRYIDRKKQGRPQQHRPARLGLRPGPLHARRPGGAGRDRVPQAGRSDQAGRRHDPLGERLRDVLVVSLDDKPLARSGRVLVQVGTRARPTGWADHEATFTADGGKQTIHGRQIDSTGHHALGHRRRRGSRSRCGTPS